MIQVSDVAKPVVYSGTDSKHDLGSWQNTSLEAKKYFFKFFIIIEAKSAWG